MITVTDSALSHLRDLLEEKGNPADQGLRLRIEKGGCAGMQYTMKIDVGADGDTVIENDGLRVFIDSESFEYLKDSQIDYQDTLTDTGFKITNPNAARSCGCGTSFEPSAADRAPTYSPEMDGSVCGEDKDR
jgi:iron-sulfur cluster assembly protein